MKLDEIIDTNIMAFRAKNPVVTKVNTKSEIGAGWYSTVHAIKDPHLVLKKGRGTSELQKDAYFRYIQYIVDNKLAESNPYFPRVYDIILVDSEKNTRHVNYSIKMETLIPYIDVTAAEMEAVAKKVVQLSVYGRWADDYFETSTAEALYALILDAVKNGIKGKYEYIADEQLAEAIKTVANIVREQNDGESRVFGPRFGWDISKNNMMFRRTSVGVQLVLTDPIA